ncbi:MAG: hypothetical protein D6788_00370 [Planctomycetota bacterium]|nr:MAG: hypothetical protein D6788_00370 [Planctomycetota bacterium]
MEDSVRGGHGLPRRAKGSFTMPHDSRSASSTLATEPPPVSHSTSRESEAPAHPIRPDPLRETALSLARRWTEDWLEIVGDSVWWCDFAPRAAQSPSDLADRSAATLALALRIEHDPTCTDERDRLVSAVRASLIAWQLSLLGDGRPIERSGRNSPDLARSAFHVGTLLAESPRFRRDDLLRDLERHLAWLSRRSAFVSASAEAYRIAALVEGGILLRNAPLLERARKNLGRLLARGHPEGWFPEAGAHAGIALERVCDRMGMAHRRIARAEARGSEDDNEPCAGRWCVAALAGMVDPLARVYALTGWSELERALRRTVSFLHALVQPDLRLADLSGDARPAWVHPYGVSVLSSEFPEAAALTRVALRLGRSPEEIDAWRTHRRTVAELGASFMMALQRSVPDPLETDPPGECTGSRVLPGAGVIVHATPAYHAVASLCGGGAIRVVWRTNGAVLHDPGVVVTTSRHLLHPHREDSVGAFDPRTRTLSVRARLRKPGRAGIVRRLLRMRPWRKCARARGAKTTEREDKPRPSSRFPLVDRVERRIVFEPESVRIEDRVHTRVRFETLGVQPRPAGTGPVRRAIHPPLFTGGGHEALLVRVYEGGTLVHLARGAPPAQAKITEAAPST